MRREPLFDPDGARVAARVSVEMSTADTKALIEGRRQLPGRVPALKQLRLVIELELRGRGDIQLFRVEVPGRGSHATSRPTRRSAVVPRSHFNELATRGKVRTGARLPVRTVKAPAGAEIS